MANTIQLRRSATPNAVPTTTQLALGELAINTYDGKLYLKKNDGTESIVLINSVGGGGGPATLTFTTTEINMGNYPRRSGSFTISGTGLVTGKPVLISQAAGPYTGKGTLADEAEMDQLLVTASVTNSTTITAYWTSNYDVRGNIKFNYIVGE